MRCMGHAANFRNTQFKACLVASEVFTHQRAVPRPEEITRMLASTAWAEVTDHSRALKDFE